MPDHVPDPLFFRMLQPFLSPQGRNQQVRFLALSALGGLLDGLSFVVLMPLAASLVHDDQRWGLGTGGWIAVLILLAISGGVLRFVSARLGYSYVIDFLRQAHEVIGQRLSRLPLSWFGPERSGRLSRLVTGDMVTVAETSAHMTGQVASSVVALLTIVAGSLVWDLRVGLTLLAIAPVAAAVMAAARALRRWASAAVGPTDRELANRIVEFATCQSALRASGRAVDFVPLRHAADRSDAARRRDLWLSILPLMCNSMIVQLLVVAVIAVVTRGGFEPVETIVFIGLLLRYARTLDQLGNLTLGLEQARRPLSDMKAIIDSPVGIEPDRSAPGDGSGIVEFRQVCFGYHADRPVLRNVSFIARRGQVTAIVGPSGSGKTTLARLVARFWDTDSGTVFVDGADVRELRTEDLMARLALVFQDTYLFDDTLWNNVAFGREGASDARIRTVSDMAGVTPIAQRIGWDAVVGEGGHSLSGGERQRVSVARALLKEAPIVLFDEATAALDADNTAGILRAMEELRRDSTCIVIAHRLETIREADQIVVLDGEGQVAEIGTHAELYPREGPYRAFWNRRAAATGWSLLAG